MGRRRLLDQEWEKRTANGRHRLGLAAVDARTSVQEVIFFERGTDYIDEHHLYVVREADEQRVDSWCLRLPLKWDWATIRPVLEEAGFVSFVTEEFVGANGKPSHLVVAIRD